MKVINYLTRDDYEVLDDDDDTGNCFAVDSETLKRRFTGATLTAARQRRDEAERVAREHQAKDGGNATS